MSEDIPMWAKERACGLVNTGAGDTPYEPSDVFRGNPAIHAFARYIAKHEEPPVDPLLGVVEEAIAGTAEKGALQLREALAKRGFKIVEAQS